MGPLCSRWVGQCLPSQPRAHTRAPCSPHGQPAQGLVVKQLPGPAHSFRGRQSHCLFLYGISQQPGGAGLRALLAPRDTAQALLSTLLLLSSQAGLAQMSQSMEMVLSPRLQFSSLAER